MAASKALDIFRRIVPGSSPLLEGNSLRKAFIGGSWASAHSQKTFEVYNPANWQEIAEIPDMNTADVLEAISQAHAAQKVWAVKPAKERSAVLKKCYSLMHGARDVLAEIVTLEQGKPLSEALAEVDYGLSFLEWFAEEGKRIYGDIIPASVEGRRVLTMKQPVGVAAVIVPWNFPVAMLLRKTSAGLAAGCGIVAKPSEETPLSAMAIAELMSQAGVPRGLFNLITCSRLGVVKVSDAICGSNDVAKVSFTGSTAVGKLLMARCADGIKRLSLELGGNAPLIVFDSADVEMAVQGTVAAKFRNTGQTCIAANRILVQEGIFERYVARLSAKIAELKLGNGFDKGVNQGPLINHRAVEKVERLVGDATAKGAEVLTGGGVDEQLGKCFYRPSLLTGMQANMSMVHEEIFGPVAPITRFSTEEEAMTLALDTEYGLASYFFSTDMCQIWRVSEQLECGMVGVNTGSISAENVPFGGIKHSGFGREGSKYGIDEYIDIKYVCMAGL